MRIWLIKTGEQIPSDPGTPRLLRTGILARYLTKPLFYHWRHTLRNIVQSATGITAITDPIVDWALAQGKRERGTLDRAFHLAVDPTPPDENALKEAEKMWDKAGISNDEDYIVGCFAGVFSKRNDVDTILKGAIDLSDEEKKKIMLVICGRGELEEDFRQLAQGQPHIIIPGWRSASEINILLQRSSFGLLPYLSSIDFQLSFPNKVGEFLYADGDHFSVFGSTYIANKTKDIIFSKGKNRMGK